MKKTLLFAAVLCGLTSFAVDPVAVWNGDFSTTTKGDYTLSDNGNAVATDGSTITISTAKGVTFERSSALAKTVGMTVIYKFDNLVVGSTIKTIGTASGGDNADRVGVNVQTSGQTSGIWANTGTYNTDATQTTISSIEKGGQFALVYGPSVSNNTGTFLYLKNEIADYTLAYSCGGLKGGNDTVHAMTVGGTRNNGGTFPAATGMVIKAVALFDQALTKDQIAAYEFPQKESSTTPVLLINIGTTTAVDGWLAHNQTEGEWIPTKTTKLSQGDVTFQVSKSTFGGNFSSAAGFGSPVTTTFESGSYSDVFGKRHDSIFDEIKTSLGLSADITESIYTTGVINGGQSSHVGTIGGLDASAKYIVYVGQGYKKKDGNDTHSFKIDADGYATVEGLDYAVTVNGTGTAKSAQYTSFDAGTTLQPGINGLLIVRMKGIVPKENGTIAFSMPTGRSGLNFLAVAKVNEIEEPGEEEEMVTIDYPATGFLTSEYQDTGWQVTLEEILKYGSFAGTMDGGYVSGNNVPAQGFHKKTGTDGSVAVVEFQMQIYQEGTSASDKYLKATRVYAKEQSGTIWLRAVQSGNIQYGTLGTEITNWNGTLAQNATANGYGVASVALSITKPVDKSVKGTIDEVTTEHSEDYASNTITAKVTIENEGEYKGEAVLVYMLDEKQYTGEITDGSALITLEGLDREKVYRGTLALGQKLEDGTVVVIEGTEVQVALYQGEQKFVWIASPFVIQEKTLVNDAQGLTIENPFEDPDYIDLCDSEFTVSISASEAVDAENDAALDGTEQGGVRIAQTSSGLKLQVVDKGDWVDFADAAVNTTYTLTVKFHYKKSQEGETDATSVTYTLDSTTKTSTNTTGKQKVTEIFVSDGTNLAADMFGACQLDKAVIVDIEIEPGDEVVGIEADNEEKAQEIAAKLKVGISEAVAAILTTAEQQEAYRAYFKIIAVKAEDGSYTAQVAFADGVESDIEKDIAEAIDDVVESFNTGAKVEIAAKPGLYYGVKRGDSLESMTVDQDSLTLATGSTVNVTITKPDASKSHFYRIIVSPTPETK